MCRLFGFRSVLQSKVHKSLISADNALINQSQEHPDGWGVCHYVEGVPQLIRSISTAIDDHLFRKVSGVVTSQTVVAHLRKATFGDLSILNTHPFQYGKWIFAHNGNIKDFSLHQSKILAKIKPSLRKFVLGQTDSECLFYFILSYLSEIISLSDHHYAWGQLALAIKKAMADLMEIIGPIYPHEDGPATENYLTFILTDGHFMIGHHGGKPLYYSTYKNRCSDRGDCPFLNKSCESKVLSGQINHLIISSEPLSGENVWEKMQIGQLVGVDEDFNLHFDQ